MRVQIAKQSDNNKNHRLRGFDSRNTARIFGSKIINRSIHKINQSHLWIILDDSAHKPVLEFRPYFAIHVLVFNQ